MNYERRNAVKRTEQFLVAILKGEYAHHYEDLLLEARSCLKHYPSEYDMACAAEQAPEIFGDWSYYEEKKNSMVLDSSSNV
jgi:hypothetical protein